MRLCSVDDLSAKSPMSKILSLKTLAYRKVERPRSVTVFSKGLGEIEG